MISRTCIKDIPPKAARTANLGIGAPLGNSPAEPEGYSAERTGAASQNAVQVAERTEIVRATERTTTIDVRRIPDAPPGGVCGFDTFETDFRGHHYTNAAKRSGPYEHYRLVYRYGYDLGADTRYRSAAWATVEQDACPRWEERNPGTWEAFKETIQYAWDQARRQY